MSERSLLPPRLKDWTEGTPQIGLFMRTEEGGVIEAANDKATPDMVNAFFLLYHEMASDKPLPEEEAEKLLKRLSRHYGQPVMPVRKYCKAIWTWMNCVTQANRDDVNNEKPHPRFSDIGPVLPNVRRAIEKSALLGRLIYGDQPLRTKECPEHKGIWRGLPALRNDCKHGCGLTGWIPDDFDPDAPCKHKWQKPDWEGRIMRCKECGEKLRDMDEREASFAEKMVPKKDPPSV